jgi:hypothetical protein
MKEKIMAENKCPETGVFCENYNIGIEAGRPYGVCTAKAQGQKCIKIAEPEDTGIQTGSKFAAVSKGKDVITKRKDELKQTGDGKIKSVQEVRNELNRKRLENENEQREQYEKIMAIRRAEIEKVYEPYKEWRLSLRNKISEWLGQNHVDDIHLLEILLTKEYEGFKLTEHPIYGESFPHVEEVFITEILPAINNVLLTEVYKKVIRL